MIFAVINQKGGAGKTTLSVHLACHLVDLGLKVAVIDSDPQASATSWVRRAAPTASLHSPQTPEALVGALQELSESHEAIVCDGAPRLNENTRVLMYMADRVLVPVLPSTLDLQATMQTKEALDVVQQARATDGMGECWVRLVLNKIRSMSELSKLVEHVLRSTGIPVANQTLGLRDAYAKAVTDNTVVTRMGKKNKGAAQAAAEVLALFDEVIPDEFRNHKRVAA